MMEKSSLSIMEVGKMMHLVFRVFKKRSEEFPFAEIKITTEQFGLLHAISIMKDDVNQTDMAEMMGKDKSAILRHIDSLEEKELVRRVIDQKDRRKNYLMVTKVGYRVIEHYIGIAKEIMQKLEDGLTEDEMLTFLKVVKHIKQKAENFYEDKY